MITCPEDFCPDFSKGLVAAIAQDAVTKDVLMLAWMNAEAWQQTLETGEVHYFSRSRQKLWHKGGTSGHVQRVKRICLDCDSDAVIFFVEQVGGAACHTGHGSCFYRELKNGVVTTCSPYVFNPEEIYK